MNLQEILQTRFGHSQFRGDQQKLIEAVLSGGSALGIMPTGSGKSLCFQIPSLVLPGLTLVVSPLIALMKDQVDQARRNGLKAAFINSSLSREEREAVLKRVARGDITLLYLTPERFRKPELWEALKGLSINLLAVDEAHCISEWGHDFRPDFTRLGEIREKLGSPPTLALTATATPEVKVDILKQLRLPPETPLFDQGIERPNLQLSTIEVHGHDEKVRNVIGLRHQHQGAIIVYFALVSSLEKFSRDLSKLNISHYIYHGQLPDKLRKKQQEEFLKDPNGLILATPAFGLGINKPDVRAVIHAEIPGSIEAYYQEVGRAGRDGEPAFGFLLYDPDDVSIQMDFIKWASPEPEFIKTVYNLIANNKDRVKAQGLDYLRQQMNFYNSRDYRLETSINLLERYGCIEGKDPRTWICVEPPSGELVDDEIAKKRLRQQQTKLLQMVELTKLEDPKPRIVEYFRDDSLS